MINDILDKVNLHKKRAKLALEEIKNWDELDSGIFEDFEKIKTIDTFIYRFIKLQDIMGEKLFKTFLDSIGEYKDNMSLLDVLDKLEKFEIISDANKWMEYRKLRNELTHEYPNNENDVIDGIKIAMDSFNEIEDIFNNIINYLSKKGLLDENK
jgi:hypothetical protein